MVASRYIDVLANKLQKVPGIGKWGGWLKKTELRYPAYLNDIRRRKYDMLAQSATSVGIPTPAEGAQIAHVINLVTGRGGEGLPAFERAVEYLNIGFFAPRYAMSRFQLIGLMAKQATKLAADGAIPGRKVSALDKQINKILAATMGRWVLGIAAFYSVLASGCLLFLDDDDWGVELNPTSSDFFKFRIGRMRIDPWAGMQQTFVFLTRMVSGRYKPAGQGKEMYKMFGEDKRYGQMTYPSTVGKFLQSKTNPLFNGAIALRTGENYFGKEQPIIAAPYNVKDLLEGKVTIQKSTAGEMALPMTLWEIMGALKEMGIPAGSALGYAAFIGLGIQIYDEPKKKRSRRRTRRRQTTVD
jgi:hypothetical protein